MHIEISNNLNRIFELNKSGSAWARMYDVYVDGIENNSQTNCTGCQDLRTECREWKRIWFLHCTQLTRAIQKCCTVD